MLAAHASKGGRGRSYFVGAVTPKDDPNRYMACIRALADDARGWGFGQPHLEGRENASSGAAAPVPLVINSHGWVHGMGLDLLSALVSDNSPTHIVRIQGASQAKQFDLPTP